VGESERLRNCQRHFCELGSRTVIDKGAYAVGLFAGKRSSEGSELNQSQSQIPEGYTDMLDTADRSSECSNCTRYKKQIAKLRKAFIEAHDENLRRCMQLENKISKLKVEKEWLDAGDISISQSKKKALEKVGSQNSNANLRAPSSVKCEEIEH
jgi:hypothetical protein